MLYPHAFKSKHIKAIETVNFRTRDKYATHLLLNPEKRPGFKRIDFTNTVMEMKLLWR